MPRINSRPAIPRTTPIHIARLPLVADQTPLQCETMESIRACEHFPHINNYVLNVRLNMKLILKYLVLHTANAEYIPNNIQAVKLYLTNGQQSNNTTCLVFETGYMIVSGARSLYETKRETHRYLAFLRTVPQPVCVQRIGAPDSTEPGPSIGGNSMAFRLSFIASVLLASLTEAKNPPLTRLTICSPYSRNI